MGGYLTAGILSVVAMYVIRKDRQLLKQMALFGLYVGVPFVMLGFYLPVLYFAIVPPPIPLGAEPYVREWSDVAFGAALVTGPVLTFLVGMLLFNGLVAYWAQNRIDEEWKEYDDQDGANQEPDGEPDGEPPGGAPL